MNKLPDPDYAAIKLRHELSIGDDAPLDFNIVLPALNIRIREELLKEGTLGACKVVGLKRLVVISTAITYEVQKRFTVAHETGHILLHHGTSYCTKDDLFGYRSSKDRENDANKFASACLLPQTAVLKALRRNDISFDMAKGLAEQYGISLTSTLIRLVTLSSDNVCLFMHSGGRIDYSIRSQNCRFRPRSGNIDPDALANRLSENETKVKGDSDCSYWFDDETLFDDCTCTEESLYFRQLQKSISIINISTDDI